SSAIAAGSTRWRRTKRPLSASLEEWPVLAATPIYKDLLYIGGWPTGHQATHGQSWPVFLLQLAHCYALVKNLHMWRGIAPKPEHRCLIPATAFAEAEG